MFLNFTDYHGNRIAIDPTRVIKLRTASLSDEPVDTVFVDYASNGTFVRGTLPEISRLLGTYVRLAPFHAPDGEDIFINKQGIASVAADDRYAGNAVLVVTVEFENVRVPARNKIPVRESVGEAEAILAAVALA